MIRGGSNYCRKLSTKWADILSVDLGGRIQKVNREGKLFLSTMSGRHPLFNSRGETPKPGESRKAQRGSYHIDPQGVI